LPLHLVAGPGVARQRIGVEARLAKRAVGHDADAVGPAAAHETVDPLVARGVTGAEADQQARIEAIVDARRAATEIVGERRGVAVARHGAQHAQGARPGAPRARCIAARDLASLGERLALPAACAAARDGHLLGDRVHEQRAALHVQRAEVGILLAADGVQRRGALLDVEHTERIQHGVEIAGGAGVDPVERAADGVLVGR
jgi:hypothetical protein